MEALQNLQKYFQADSLQVTHKSFPRDTISNSVNASYLNSINLYIDTYGVIPNLFTIENIEVNKAVAYLKENYASEITDSFHNTNYVNFQYLMILDYYFFLYEDLMIFVDEVGHVRFYYKNTPTKKVHEIAEELKLFVEVFDACKPKMHVISNGFDGLTTTELDILKPEINFDLNYNDDFNNIDTIIRTKLSASDSKGLVLLYGKPGTGKTTYIRHLISTIHKKIIFLPPGMAAGITQPVLLDLLMKYTNSVLVIEDSELLIADRERENSPVAALLNITDGLLSETLKIQVICSFNTELAKIDSALLRKGRLIAKYEFKELEQSKATELAKHLGIDVQFTEATSLADVYYAKEQGFANITAKNKIGFTTNTTNHG